MSIKRLSNADISNVFGGAIIEVRSGIFYVVEDNHDHQPKVLAGPFFSYENACNRAAMHGVATYMLAPMSYRNLVDELLTAHISPDGRYFHNLKRVIDKKFDAMTIL